MQNASIFELRRRAQKWPTCDDAQKVMDQMFAILLHRAITDRDSGLDIVIMSDDPHGYRLTQRNTDKIYVVDPSTDERAGTRQRRLSREYVLSAYLAAVKSIKPGVRGGSAPTALPTPHELAKLRHDAEQVLGRIATVPRVFKAQVSGADITQRGHNSKSMLLAGI